MTQIGFGPSWVASPEGDEQLASASTSREQLVWSFDPEDHPCVIVQVGNRVIRTDADETDLSGIKPRDLALLVAVLEHSLSNVRAAQGATR